MYPIRFTIEDHRSRHRTRLLLPPHNRQVVTVEVVTAGWGSNPEHLVLHSFVLPMQKRRKSCPKMVSLRYALIHSYMQQGLWVTGTDLSLCGPQDNDDILNVVALEWKKLSDRDRAHWDEEARNDKVRCVSCSSKECPVDKFLFSHSLGRYVREKAAYKGSWAVKKCRAKKHPLAPKRPMINL